MKTVTCEIRKIFRVTMQNRWHWDYPEDDWRVSGDGESAEAAYENAFKAAYEGRDDFVNDGHELHVVEQLGYNGKFVDYDQSLDIHVLTSPLAMLEAKYRNERDERLKKKAQAKTEAYLKEKIEEERKQYETLKAKFEKE